MATDLRRGLQSRGPSCPWMRGQPTRLNYLSAGPGLEESRSSSAGATYPGLSHWKSKARWTRSGSAPTAGCSCLGDPVESSALGSPHRPRFESASRSFLGHSVYRQLHNHFAPEKSVSPDRIPPPVRYRRRIESIGPICETWNRFWLDNVWAFHSLPDLVSSSCQEMPYLSSNQANSRLDG